MDDMIGLRGRKKLDRRRELLVVAGERFRSVGFDATRMEDIAAGADVGTGTAYNYFANKGELLLAIASIEVEGIMEKARIALERPVPDIATALDRLVAAYLDNSLVFLDKAMWRAAIALSVKQPDMPFGRRYSELDASLVRQISELFLSLQAKRLIAPAIDTACASQLFYNNLTTMFSEFIKHDASTIAEIKDAIRSQCRPIVHYLSARSD